MFVQVIQGKVSDAGEARTALDQWAQELAPDATGWLGSTAGVTRDGKFIAIARFESEDAARHNSERPEQDAWWAQTSKLFTDEPTFKESTEVDVDMPGDPDKAKFVQVIQGRTSDPARARQLMQDNPDSWAEFRPDVLGSVGASHDGGAYTAVLYFTNEAEAREGERKEMPPDMQAQMAEMGKLEIGEPTFLDITDPWLYSPR